MRTLRLARIAAEAEGMRLREQLRRTVVRAVFGVIALVFLFSALTFAHVAAWFWLRLRWEAPESALAIAGADIVIAGLLVLLAGRSKPSRVEMEALAVREQALQSAKATLGATALVTQFLRLLANLVTRSGR